MIQLVNNADIDEIAIIKLHALLAGAFKENGNPTGYKL